MRFSCPHFQFDINFILVLVKAKEWYELRVVCKFIRIPKKPEMELTVAARVASNMQRETLPLIKIAVHVQNIFFLPVTPLTEQNKTQHQVSQAELLISLSFHGKQQEWLYKTSRSWRQAKQHWIIHLKKKNVFFS